MGVSPQQFAAMQQRVSGTRRTARPAVPATAFGGPRPAAIILGIDPSLRGTGWGVIRPSRPHPVFVACGVVHCPAGWERSRCLAHIARSIREVVQQHHPAVCAIEGLFFAQNLQTALTMGEARGASLATVAEAGLDIFEIAPRKVKQAMVGYGAADKTAVARMVQRMLSLPEPPAPDAADALALALTHAQEQGRHTLTPARRI